MEKEIPIDVQLTRHDAWVILRALANHADIESNDPVRSHQDHSACSYLADRLLRLLEKR